MHLIHPDITFLCTSTYSTEYVEVQRKNIFVALMPKYLFARVLSNFVDFRLLKNSFEKCVYGVHFSNDLGLGKILEDLRAWIN